MWVIMPNGAKELYDRNKIYKAVEKAWVVANPKGFDFERIFAVEETIKKAEYYIFNRKCFEITADQVQDCVEYALMETDPKAAKEYIIDRYKKSHLEKE